jgi:hypothetical protein
MKEMFINPLLHPYANASPSTVIEYDDLSQVETPVESSEHLPIASRFRSSHAVVSDDSEYDNGGARNTSHASHRGGQINLDSSPELLQPLPGIARVVYGGIAPHQLPDDLQRCLQSIEGILAGHLKLVKALQK